MQAGPSGRVVLLTGAAGGIGRCITAALLKDGHAVAAVDRDADALKRLAADNDAPETKGRLHTITQDLEFEFACDAAVRAARGHFGRVDAVINNAGIGMSTIRPDAEAKYPTIEELTPEAWEPFLAIFVRAPIRDHACRPAVHEGARMGPHRQQHDELSHHAARAALRGGEGRARSDVRGVGEGT